VFRQELQIRPPPRTEILTRLAELPAVLAEPGGHPWRSSKITAFLKHTRARQNEAKFNLTRLGECSEPLAERQQHSVAECGNC